MAWATDVLSTLYDVPVVTTFHGTERGRHGGHLPPGSATDINSVEWWQAYRSRRVIASTRLMVRERPGLFIAGEMLDWEAPTGGYLLTACFASGVAAGEGVLAWRAETAQAAT